MQEKEAKEKDKTIAAYHETVFLFNPIAFTCSFHQLDVDHVIFGRLLSVMLSRCKLTGFGPSGAPRRLVQALEQFCSSVPASVPRCHLDSFNPANATNPRRFFSPPTRASSLAHHQLTETEEVQNKCPGFGPGTKGRSHIPVLGGRTRVCILTVVFLPFPAELDSLTSVGLRFLMQ